MGVLAIIIGVIAVITLMVRYSIIYKKVSGSVATYAQNELLPGEKLCLCIRAFGERYDNSRDGYGYGCAGALIFVLIIIPLVVMSQFAPVGVVLLAVVVLLLIGLLITIGLIKGATTYYFVTDKRLCRRHIAFLSGNLIKKDISLGSINSTKSLIYDTENDTSYYAKIFHIDGNDKLPLNSAEDVRKLEETINLARKEFLEYTIKPSNIPL